MTQSNINIRYEEIVADLAERTRMIMDEGTTDETDAILQAIDEGLIYSCDQAYVIAHAFYNGFIEWGKDPQWDAIHEDLVQDVMDEVNYGSKQH